MSDDLPAPDTPVTATSTPSGNATSMFLRLCSRAPLTFRNPCGLRRSAGTSMRSTPDRNFPVSDAGSAFSSSGVPSATTRPPRRPGARAEVDDVVGRLDGLGVVLDDDDAVAEIAQPPQRRDEAQVVALVQADRRLVEHVHHARQLRAELRRQADALRLAARQRRGRAVERQVLEARRRAGSRGARSPPSGSRRRSARARRAGPGPRSSGWPRRRSWR